MRRLQEPVEAMKEIELAIEAGAESWRFLMIKAKILASQYKWQEAIDTMIRSNKLLESDSAQMKENSDDYWENKLFVAEWLRDLGQTDKSLEYYRACYEHDPDDYDLLPPMLEIPRCVLRDRGARSTNREITIRDFSGEPDVHRKSVARKRQRWFKNLGE